MTHFRSVYSVSPPSPRRRVNCTCCGDARFVSDRHARALGEGKFSGMCPDCRKRPRVRVTQQYRNYWLDRFTMDEIREMGGALDLLLNDHSRFAHDGPKRGAEWAA